MGELALDQSEDKQKLGREAQKKKRKEGIQCTSIG